MSQADESARTEGPAGSLDLPHGWVRIGRRRWWSTWAGINTVGVVLFVVYGGMQATRLLWTVVPLPLALVAAAVVVAMVLLLITSIRNLRYPQPWVNLDTGELRARRRVVSLQDVDRATIPVDPELRRDVLILRLLAAHARVEIIVRDRRGPALDRVSSDALVEALRRTSIAMPTSSNDPTGRFARFNFPGHISREDAIALAAEPPAVGAPLPASW